MEIPNIALNTSSGLELAPDVREFSSDNLDDIFLDSVNIKIPNGLGTGSRLFVIGSSGHVGASITKASSNSTIVLHRSNHKSNITIQAGGEYSYTEVHALGGGAPNSITIHNACNNGKFSIGKGTTAVGATFLLEGDGQLMSVGDDCMFSWGIFVRNYDSHCIFDTESLEQINGPRDLKISDHVWVGQDAMLMPGAEIGCGSIVAARAVVTAPIPERSVAAGVPARVIKANRSWTRSGGYSSSAVKAVMAKLSPPGMGAGG